MAECLRTGEPQRNQEVWIERPDGSRIAVMVDIEPLTNSAGDLVGAVNCFRDITEKIPATERVAASERRLSEILQGLSAAVYTTDAEGLLTFYNKAAAELWGHQPKLHQMRWCGSYKLAHPDGTPMRHDDCPMAEDIIQNRAIRGAEAMAVKPDGTSVPFLAFPSPLQDSNGNLIGAVNMLVDISELAHARDELNATERFTRQILESSRDCIKVLDLDARLRSINDCGRAYLEIEDDCQVVGLNYLDFWQDEHRIEAEKAVNDALSGKSGRFTASFITPSGQTTWWDEVVTPVRGSDGEIKYLLVVSRDISERKSAEEQRELLIDELNHRVKNTLATVQSIAMHTLRPDTQISEALLDFENRLLALSGAHSLLSLVGWQSADFKPLVCDVVSPFADDKSHTVRLRGPSVKLPSRPTVLISMILHELVTNAAKYGSLSKPGGCLSLTWRLFEKDDAEFLRINWLERGGPKVNKPDSTGFGMRLIEKGVEHELNGETSIRFEPDGLRCRIEFPV